MLRKRYREMLGLVLYGNVVELTPLIDERIDAEENRLLDLGVGDYFDSIIFSTAVHYADALLTEDGELHGLWRGSEEYRGSLVLYTWRDFRALR